MNLSFKGRYFNGKSSTPITVDIAWHAHGLELIYTNANNQYETVFWNKAEIHQTEVSSGIVTLKYGDTVPQQQLEVTDPDFIALFKKEYAVGFTYKAKLNTAPILIGLVLLIGLSGWLVYVFLLPAIADYGARVFPKEYEIKLGEQLYSSVLQGEEIDSAKTVAINQFFNQLNMQKDYPVRITVVKSKVVNAFALPGGGIVVYDAILKDMKNSDQLAALLAHEYSHVQLKHATRNMFRSLAGYLFISVVFSDVNGIGHVLVENAHQLRNLSYSRELETEADNNGLQILQRNNISATGMKDLFAQLKKESGGVEVSEIISTHPDLDNRIQNADQFLKSTHYKFIPNDSMAYYFKQLKATSIWNE